MGASSDSAKGFSRLKRQGSESPFGMPSKQLSDSDLTVRSGVSVVIVCIVVEYSIAGTGTAMSSLIKRLLKANSIRA
jgi:hypothetical protein